MLFRSTFDQQMNLVPDILDSYEVEEGRIFTLHLRPGHKWSDGHPFTAEDFRFYWEDVALNEELSRGGPPIELLVDGKPPVFEVLDELTVRYSWDQPNPEFLTAIAGALPVYLYQPAHYLKQFHIRYGDPEEIERMVKAENVRGWSSLYTRKSRQYRQENVDLPSLQPWVIATTAPAEQFVFKRNPYFHRIDANGRQLPYVDEIVMAIASSAIIPAKTGSGEADLQARYIRFDNYTFLKESEKRQPIDVMLWRTAKGSQVALYPNLNYNDPVWREVLRDVRFRRALSLAINRHEINQVVYYGLVHESADTVLPESPLYRPDYRDAWTQFDLDRANALLDEMGLERGPDGIRHLPDGRPLDIIVETAGESTEETDVLQLIRDSWAEVGIRLYPRTSQRDVFRNRVFSGMTMMSVWSGLANAIPTADMSPRELAPTTQQQLQWPLWGQYFETGGDAGEPPDMEEPKQLLELFRKWRRSTDRAEKQAVWHQMLSIFTDQVYSIGTVNGAWQPVVVRRNLRNVPEDGIYNWDPGAYFGMYLPDTFWFDDANT